MSLFSSLCLLEIVLIWQREILSSSFVGVKKRFSRNDKHYVGMFRISSPSNLFYTVDLKLNSIWSGIPNENGLFLLFSSKEGKFNDHFASIDVSCCCPINDHLRGIQTTYLWVFYEGASRCNSFFRSLLPQEFSIFINGTSVF